MGTLHQYFETDCDYALRVRAKLPGSDAEAVAFFDPNGLASFLACYLPGADNSYEYFERFLAGIQYGATPLELELAGAIVLPRASQLCGQLRVENANPLRVEYQLYGDPVWRDVFAIRMTRRVFIYSETNLKPYDVQRLEKYAESLGHFLQFRDQAYVSERTRRETVLAFISHDSRDKESVARPIALNLQSKLCPVWYDEFALKLGDHLRESIEKGLRECKKCVLILSPNFFSNKGWGRKEFDSIFTREILEEKKLVLPVWYGVTKQQVFDYSPSLLNVKGVDWQKLGEEEVCRQIFLAVTERA